MVVPSTGNRPQAGTSVPADSAYITALKTVLVALGISGTFCVLLVGIPLVFFVGLSREDTAGNYLRAKLAAPPTHLITVDVNVNAPEEPDGIIPTQRRNIDWAYSLVDLMKLANLEDELFTEFVNSTVSTNENSFLLNLGASNVNDEAQWWIKDYRESSLQKIENLRSGVKNSSRVSTIISHPFLSLRMMKRFSRLSEILEREQYTDRPFRESDFFKKINQLASEVILPKKADVENIMNSILELQFVYDLLTNELFYGKFGEVDTGFGLSLEEAYEMGVYAYQRQMFTEALDWLQTVLEKVNENPLGTKLNNDTVFALILEVTQKHDELIDKISHKNYYDVYHRYSNKIMSAKNLLTLKEEDTVRFLATDNTNFYPAYTLLCAGKNLMSGSEENRSKLLCWNERKSDLAWLINPLKMEVLSWDPYLFQIHDAIGEKVVEFVRQASVPKMNRASMNNRYADNSSIYGSNATTLFKTSSEAILFGQDEDDARILQPFDRKVGRMTQLAGFNVGDHSMSVSKELIVSTYAFGGQFAPHLDTANIKTELNATVGDRLATFMVYLNNVQHGGFTVFPKLGISVVPKKGSALVWYDLFQNGTTDPRILHAGCPVILGQKWIATKTIRFHAKFQKRKCSMNGSSE